MNECVEISLVYSDGAELKIEKVDAIKSGRYYQLKAIPAFANNLAFDDIITAEEEDGYLFFEELVKQSGNSVIHLVILKPEATTNLSISFIALGLGINHLYDHQYIAVSVPQNVNYLEVKSILKKERRLGNIDFKEACLSDKHQSD